MKLQHTRVNKAKDLPRRIVASKQPHANRMNSSSYGNLRDYMLAHCDSRDEITESKQMLFEKHVGDISDGRNQLFSRPFRVSSLRNRNFHLNREQSDDCISSNYPNSSHSPVRDLTCSSISSVMAASSSANVPDDLDTLSSRTRQTDDGWKEKRWRTFGTSLMHDSIEERETADPHIFRDYANVVPTNDVPAPTTPPPVVVCDMHACQAGPSNEQPKRERFGGRGKSMELPERTIQMRNQTRIKQTWPNPEFQSVDDASTTRMPSGYTREHLMRAQRFGAVIGSIRKPGHHVGPSKNPDCTCEYCRRWFAERGDNFRERASSLDITFISCSPNQRYTRKF